MKPYLATLSSERTSSNLLRQRDGSGLKQQHEMLSSDELKALEEETTHTIDIGQFAPAAPRSRTDCLSADRRRRGADPGGTQARTGHRQ